MDLERISEALRNYTGQEDSMNSVVAVLQEELGENWTTTVFQDLENLPPALKDRLNHAFNYYAATMAWNEIQEYLADKNLTRSPEIDERLPILKHWLDFFGEPGQEAYQELEDRLNSQPETEESANENFAEEGADSEDMTSENEEIEPRVDVDENEIAEDSEQEDDEEESERPEADELSDSEGETFSGTDEGQEPAEEELLAEDNEVIAKDDDNPLRFEIEKVEKQLTLLDQNQAWLAARCIQLKNIEVYSYPFYGFIVDLMRQVLKSMDALLENEETKDLIEEFFEGGQEAFNRKKESIEHEIELAEQNCESSVTALISEDMDMDEIKRTLGTIDASDTVEYVGPAPDGFELLDDETPLDENVIKKQYEKLENIDALTGSQKNENISASLETQENSSQNSQKGVQRKLSFSLKKKKPVDSET